MDKTQRDAAQRVVGLTANLMAGTSLEDARVAMGDSTATDMLAGSVLGARVALDRLAKSARLSIADAATRVQITLRGLAVEDRPDFSGAFGDDAYERATLVLRWLAEAMETKGKGWSVPPDPLAFIVVLWATIDELGRQHRITTAEAARKLALDIAGIRTTDA